MKNLFIPTTKKTRNATIDTNILRTGDCFFVSGLQRAKNKHENNCIDVATRYLENLRTTVRGPRHTDFTLFILEESNAGSCEGKN